MRTAVVLLALTVAATGCFHRRPRFPGNVAVVTRHGKLKRAAPPRIALDNRGADGIVVVEERFTFVIPNTWRAASGSAFRDPAERHAVTIAAYDKELEPDAWLSTYYPNAKSWAVENGVMVISAKQTTTLVAATDRDLFELTCAQSDASKDVPNAVCRDVVSSFRLR